MRLVAEERLEDVMTNNAVVAAAEKQVAICNNIVAVGARGLWFENAWFYYFRLVQKG